MPRVYVCRMCDGPPLPKPPEGACPWCSRFARWECKHVREGEVEGAEIAPIKEGEPISFVDLMAGKDDESMGRRPTGSPGVDYIFDGGLPYFGTVFFGGAAGAGKTTWLFTLLHRMAHKYKLRTMLDSSEQDENGLRRQFKRLELPPTEHMIILAQDDFDAILSAIEDEEPAIFALDSVADVDHVTDASGFDLASGQPTAIARVAKEIRKLSSKNEFFAFLVGHATNEGEMKGGTQIRHEVDATLWLDYYTTPEDPRRVLYFKGKTRLGPLGRKALFKMTNKGMIDLGPLDPSSMDRVAGEDMNAAREAAREEARAASRRAPDHLPEVPPKLTGKKPGGNN